MAHPKVTVVGAGQVGATTALWLAKRGLAAGLLLATARAFGEFRHQYTATGLFPQVYQALQELDRITDYLCAVEEISITAIEKGKAEPDGANCLDLRFVVRIFHVPAEGAK